MSRSKRLELGSMVVKGADAGSGNSLMWPVTVMLEEAEAISNWVGRSGNMSTERELKRGDERIVPPIRGL